KFVEHNGEELAIFRHLDALRLGAENGNAGGFQSIGEIERRLSTELHHYAFGLFLVVNIEHVLKRKRLKIKFVASVVIGRNRFRIGIYHDGFETELAQSEGGVDAAIIEFDALADAVGTATENHDFAFTAFAALILASVGGIIIRGISFEFGRAGIDQAIGRGDVLRDSLRANGLFRNTTGNCELPIRKPELFRAEKGRR